MSRKLIITLALALTVFLVVMLWWQHQQLVSARSRPSTYPTDQPFIARAVSIWAAKSKETPTRGLNNRYPVTVHLRTIVCVELRLQRGSVGGSPTYCFMEEGSQLIYKYDDLE